MEKFEYAKAVSALEEIAGKVGNPETRVEDMEALVAQSKELVSACRAYLRGIKEKIDKIDDETE